MHLAHWLLRSYMAFKGQLIPYLHPGSGHMWESQVLLTDGQVVFLRVLRFSPTFDERSARYKWNILERAVKPKSKKKKKKNTVFTLSIRTLTLYSHTCFKIWTSTIYYPMLCLKIARWVANSVDPDEMLQNAPSHLGPHCLIIPVCLNTYGDYRYTLHVRQSCQIDFAPSKEGSTL